MKKVSSRRRWSKVSNATYRLKENNKDRKEAGDKNVVSVLRELSMTVKV